MRKQKLYEYGFETKNPKHLISVNAKNEKEAKLKCFKVLEDLGIVSSLGRCTGTTKV